MKSFLSAKSSIGIAFLLAISFARAEAPEDDSKKTYENAQIEAKNLTAKQLYDQIKNLMAIMRLKRQEGQSVWASVVDDVNVKAGAYTLELKRRRGLEDPEAAFYYALNNMTLCGSLQELRLAVDSHIVNSCWEESITGFKIASKSGFGAASYNIALIYENGWGVRQSKLSAADWYIKSANQNNLSDDRDGALSALEAALKLVPDHPTALRLRQDMLR